MSDLKPADVVRYLSQRNAKPECQQCDANDWEITDSDRDGAAYVALQPGGHDSKVTSHVPVMLMVCRNCANTRLLASLPIKEWLQEERCPS